MVLGPKKKETWENGRNEPEWASRFPDEIVRVIPLMRFQAEGLCIYCLILQFSQKTIIINLYFANTHCTFKRMNNCDYLNIIRVLANEWQIDLMGQN